jgi:branched-chain amino acid transport system substrate-binding protein
MKRNFKSSLMMIFIITLSIGSVIASASMEVTQESQINLDTKYTVVGTYEDEVLIMVETLYNLNEKYNDPLMDSFKWSGQKWAREDQPIEFYIDDNGDNGDPSDEFVVIPRAAQTLEDDYASDIDFTYMGTSHDVTTPSHDGINNIRFVSKDGPGGNYATTFYWFTLPSQQIIEFDITFDDDENWIDGSFDGVDLETVALRYFSEALGLDMDTNPKAVMYPFFSPRVQRELYYTDLMGLRYIYPGPGITHPDATRINDEWYPVYIMLGDIMAEVVEETNDLDEAIVSITEGGDTLEPGGTFYSFVQNSFNTLTTHIDSQFTAITLKLDQIADAIENESEGIIDRIYQLRDILLEDGRATRAKVDLVRETVDNTLDVKVVTGEKESRYYSYYIHMREWSDGDYLDPIDPELNIRAAINDEPIPETHHNIIRISQGLCKLLIDKKAVPVGTNALIVDVEYHGVHGSDIIPVEKLRETKEIVKIGVIYASDATFPGSQPVLETATTDINSYCENLGYDIEFEFIVTSAEANADIHLERVQEFYDQGINLLIGGMWSSQAARSLDFVNENEMILFSPSSTLPSLAIPDDNLYRLTSDDLEQSKAIAAILEDREINSIVVLQIELDVINGVYNSVKYTSNERGIHVFPATIYPYGSRDNTGYDFSTYLAEAESTAEDAITAGDNVALLILGFHETAGILNQVYDNPTLYPSLDSITWYGWQATSNSVIIESEAWDAAAKYELLSTSVAPTRSAKWYEFVDELGYDPGFYQACLYDIAWIYAKAVLEASTTNTVNVESMLYDVTDQYYGVTGWCNLNEAGDRSPLDFDIVGFDSVDGWYLAGRYDKYAETIFRR